MKLFDYYITPEDVGLRYSERKWLGPEYRNILMAFRNLPTLSYHAPDQREVSIGAQGRIVTAGYVRHYGKAISVEQWEATCEYYSRHFPKYSAKWEARKGKAVHVMSDFGNELIRWEERDEKGVDLDLVATGPAADTCNPGCDSGDIGLKKHPPQGRKDRAMKILLTNHHLLNLAGSETFTYTIADFLKRKGHEVVVYSRYVDKMLRFFRSIEVPVATDMEEIRGMKFDVAHVHHNINAIEVRHAFPDLPMVFLSHGVIPFLEQPPVLDLGIARFLAVSEEVRDNLVAKGVDAGEIEIFRNMVDAGRFAPGARIGEKPSRALVLSYKIDPETESVIREACRRRDIECEFAGGRFGFVEQELLPSHINKADIVFSLGRGVIETMLCGRVPIVLDRFGGDGMVTPGNLPELMKFNFSGRRYGVRYTVDRLLAEFEKYDSMHGPRLRVEAVKYFGAAGMTDQLIGTYDKVMRTSLPRPAGGCDKVIDGFVESLSDTRRSCELVKQMGMAVLEEEVREKDKVIKTMEQEASKELELTRKVKDSMPVLVALLKGMERENVSPSLLLKAGELCFGIGLAENAQGFFEKALSLEPGNGDALNNLGVLNFHFKRYNRARVFFERSLASNPGNRESAANLANLEYLSKRTTTDETL